MPSLATPEIPHRTWRRRVARCFILFGIVPYLSVIIIFTVLQRRLMYRPTVATNLKVEDLQLDADNVSDVQLRTPDGATLNGWLLKPRVAADSNGNSGLVIYFPGNAENRFHRLTDLKEVASCGFQVLIFDYRGYGDSSGSPSESAICADARRIWNYAHDDLDFADDQIVLFGESLGGAVALSLWSDPDFGVPRPRALILSSTFASMSRTVACSYRWFPFQYLVLDRWPSIDRIPRVDIPVTIYHGTADEIVPISEARALASAAGEDATFVEIPNGEHNDIPMSLLRAQLKDQLRLNLN